MGISIAILWGQDFDDPMEGFIVDENPSEHRLLGLDILRRKFVGGKICPFHRPSLLNHPNFELGNDIGLELDRDRVHAHVLYGFVEKDFLPIHLDMVLLEIGFDVHRSDGAKELATFSGLFGNRAGEAFDLLGQTLGVLSHFTQTMLDLPFLMLKGF